MIRDERTLPTSAHAGRKTPSKTGRELEEPGFTEADAKMLEEAEGLFRDLASQMSRLELVRSGDGKCGADWYV